MMYYSITSDTETSDGKSGSFPRTGSFGQFVSMNRFKKRIIGYFTP